MMILVESGPSLSLMFIDNHEEFRRILENPEELRWILKGSEGSLYSYHRIIIDSAVGDGVSVALRISTYHFLGLVLDGVGFYTI